MTASGETSTGNNRCPGPPQSSASSKGKGTLQLLFFEGGFRSIKLWACKVFRDGGGFHPVRSWLALKAETLWSHGDHDGVRQVAQKLVTDYDSTLGYYFLAQSSFVRGDFEDAASILKKLLEKNPQHSDGSYLLAACCVETGDRAMTWTILERMALRSPRAKTWQHLANLVENPNDLQRLLKLHEKAVTMGTVPSFSKSVSNHLALAAMRGNEHETAKSLWRGIIRDALASPGRFKNRRPRVDIYSQGLAENALIDLKRTLEDADIGMFLVSGTLLGCMREGRLLGHDKDIDVGIWEDVPLAKVQAALHKSGLFFFIQSRSEHIVRVRHLNGIPLDLFYHYREASDYWHGGAKLKWHNSPFELKSVEFLGQSFLVPANHETYLEENYGDWITPKTDFDSAFDTPNGEVTQHDEMIVHSLRMLFDSVAKGAPDKSDYYLKKLENLGEHDFVAEFREKHQTAAA